MDMILLAAVLLFATLVLGILGIVLGGLLSPESSPGRR